MFKSIQGCEWGSFPESACVPARVWAVRPMGTRGEGQRWAQRFPEIVSKGNLLYADLHLFMFICNWGSYHAVICRVVLKALSNIEDGAFCENS